MRGRRSRCQPTESFVTRRTFPLWLHRDSGGELRGPLRWAVAGRSRNKLQEVLERAAERLGTDRGRVARGGGAGDGGSARGRGM